jgi:hypothetical protein
MTEAEWLKCDKPELMLEPWPWPVSERKMRLFACACCRQIWPYLTAPESRRAVELSEAYADGLIEDTERAAAHQAATVVARRERASAPVAAEWASSQRIPQFRLGQATADSASGTAYHAAEAAYSGAYYAAGTADRAAFDAGTQTKELELAAQAHLLRDIFGNPYRPVVLDPPWHTSTVLALAEGIYSDRAFDRLPILADALQDAGCDHSDILDHCRGPGPHVRGCWVVDLILGKD